MTNFSPRVLITGANGQLGLALSHHPLASEFYLTACSHRECDITDRVSLQRAIHLHSPDIIINAAAYTAVDKAEQEHDKALLVNQVGAQNLAHICTEHQLPLIHLSTDYIFDGRNASPYSEEDTPHPLNYYGKSKWLGEEAVRIHTQQHVILRVSGIFSEYGNNFLKTILRLAQEKTTLRIVADQLTCPTSASDIAGAIFAIAKQPQLYGTYHYCSGNPVSWHTFAAAIIAIAKPLTTINVTEVQPILAAEYATSAERPAYSVLDCTKIQTDYGIQQPHWEEAVKYVVTHLCKGQDA